MVGRGLLFTGVRCGLHLGGVCSLLGKCGVFTNERWGLKIKWGRSVLFTGERCGTNCGKAEGVAWKNCPEGVPEGTARGNSRGTVVPGYPRLFHS